MPCVSYLSLGNKWPPKFLAYNNIYHLTVDQPISDRSRQAFMEWFWLCVSHEATIKMSTMAESPAPLGKELTFVSSLAWWLAGSSSRSREWHKGRTPGGRDHRKPFEKLSACKLSQDLSPLRQQCTEGSGCATKCHVSANTKSPNTEHLCSRHCGGYLGYSGN